MTATLLLIADSILFFFLSLVGIYLLIFALASMCKRTNRYPKSEKKHRFALLIPTGTPFPPQEYPNELYDTHPYENLPETVQALEGSKYDVAVILGEATQVPLNLLQRVNNAYNAGATAMQFHHIIENRRTKKRHLQAIREEIDHSLFKLGHTQLGLASALDGMDMALDMKWLQKNLKSKKSNLERRLLRQHIFIEYFDYIEIGSPAARQRTHRISRKKILSDLPEALLTAHWDYADKLFQRLVPSWSMLLTVTAALAIVTTCYNWTLSLKWWGGLFCLLLTICFAIPDYLVEKKKKKKLNS